jgi:hypothetical protein
MTGVARRKNDDARDCCYADRGITRASAGVASQIDSCPPTPHSLAVGRPVEPTCRTRSRRRRRSSAARVASRSTSRARASSTCDVDPRIRRVCRTRRAKVSRGARGLDIDSSECSARPLKNRGPRDVATLRFPPVATCRSASHLSRRQERYTRLHGAVVAEGGCSTRLVVMVAMCERPEARYVEVKEWSNGFARRATFRCSG